MTERDETHDLWLNAPFELRPDTPAPLFAQLARAIRFKIIQWGLPAGSILPSESAFAAEHHLSRETVRNAYRVLRETGQIEVRRGRGHFVAQEVPRRYVEVGPGSEITARSPHPGDEPGDDEYPTTSVALIVEEPGKRPVAYDATRTVIVLRQAP